MKMRIMLLLAGVLLISALAASAAEPAAGNTASSETTAQRDAAQRDAAQRDARMQWWREARFGMFIHWGVYSVPAGSWQGKPVPSIGEWIMNTAKIPVADYAALTKQFNPVKFDADLWVSRAKQAGMKYIVITSKHHDGFAMFHSAASPYNIYDATPFKRDPLKELTAACQKQGIRLGFYYSQAQDWHHPGGAALNGGHWDKAQDGDMDQYLRTVAVPQVREILNNYGPISILWWDTPADMTKERADLFQPLLKLQPGIITNNRLGGGYEGDSETPEQFIPSTGMPGRDWETCMTMNDTWGYKADDQNWKPAPMLIRNLADIASKGGNYLLNVGPTSEGEFPAPIVERLQAIGQWMQVNSESIYGTTASPFRRLDWGRCTQKPGRLFMHVFEWPKDGALAVPGLKNRITKAWLLSDAKQTPLAVTASESGMSITVGVTAPDAIDSVIVAEIEGQPQVAIPALVQAADGTVALGAADAELHGQAIRLQNSAGKENIGFWTDAADYVSWPVTIKQPGQFTVELSYACDNNSPGSEYEIGFGPEKIAGKIEGTGTFNDFATKKIGTVKIAAAGPVVVTVKATRKPGLAVMNLQAIKLVPVK